MSQTPSRTRKRALKSIERRMAAELKKAKPNQVKLTALFRKAQMLGVPGDFE
jgi:uncharacterized protein involved in exopolysaccharide biosynthesis